jgi:sterol desaturase/sphingolipid hydroxylase (fatty acid hydroxylase superfamily)
MSNSEAVAFPWWLQTTVILGSLLMATGAVLALANPQMLVYPGAQINDASRTFAGYFFGRNLVLAVFLLAALLQRARGQLSTLLLLTGFIQVIDVVLDCVERRWPIVPIVAIFAVMFFLSSVRLSGSPFWKAQAWKQIL